jgi:sensitive to high expression protein 9
MTKGATRVQRTVFTGRPPSSHPSDTVDDDVAKVTGSSLNRAPDAPSEDHRSSKDVLDLDKKSSFDLEALRIRFRQLSDRSAAAVRRRADDFTAKTASTFSQLGSHLNRVTGYEEIEVLKRRVVEQGVCASQWLERSLHIDTSFITEGRIAMTRQAAREAKTAYDEAVLRRSNAQREINDLLQRPKSTWSESDVIRFTTLFQQDHLHEQPEEVRAKAAAADADEAVDREFSQLCVLHYQSYLIFLN